ncbi:hypothetical protein GCM10011517_05280 [Actibacterium pelagium]|uniref:Phage gp6-like head-tail connector protein n=2 Tax=Actibacterium pelagium TaxID=2029103 RepID=A0A917ADI6_9RHOB|nr:head-tail connector protein [Actibacterium pelagium]GGE40567.1 hypothetical protein GCM10011517_05280 [Actibacterium pelagium]
MMLSVVTPVPDAALPVEAFKDHLRLGTGFASSGSEDALLLGFLRAAMAAVEGRTGKALLLRTYQWTLTAWRDATRQALPVAPVAVVSELRLTDSAGSEEVVAAETYRLVRDTHRPLLEALGIALPMVPLGGEARVTFDAGFAADWTNLPADLAQAVFMLAAHYYEHRQSSGFGEPDMPYDVAKLIEPWRTVRILGGGRP